MARREEEEAGRGIAQAEPEEDWTGREGERLDRRISPGHPTMMILVPSSFHSFFLLRLLRSCFIFPLVHIPYLIHIYYTYLIYNTRATRPYTLALIPASPTIIPTHPLPRTS
ncbi:hypothetical protein B0H12DRAFT_1149151 [Mycena haematopus]|nr:hypothetical protein B0H12DRAFT_1149151 [Mycena haematopus]